MNLTTGTLPTRRIKSAGKKKRLGGLQPGALRRRRAEIIFIHLKSEFKSWGISENHNKYDEERLNQGGERNYSDAKTAKNLRKLHKSRVDTSKARPCYQKEKSKVPGDKSLWVETGETSPKVRVNIC